jgi:hypothetical protein
MKESRPFGGGLLAPLRRNEHAEPHRCFPWGRLEDQNEAGDSAPYGTQQEALLDALHSAGKAGKRGEAVEVLLAACIHPISLLT